MLFAAYAITLGIDGGDDARVLAAAEELLGGDGLSRGAQGVGFPLLLAPAVAIGGVLPELAVAAVAALGYVLAAALARRVVPEPWAGWAALLAGLSVPALGYATAVAPAAVAGTVLAGAVLCTLAVRERPLQRWAFGGAALLALLPWLDPWLLVPALPVAVLLARWTARRGRRLVALGTAEIQLASLVFYVSLNERLYGGLTPLAALDGPATGASGVGEHAERVTRVATLLVDADGGLLRWAPLFALAAGGAWLLWHSRRTRVARAVPERRDAEHAAFICLAVCGAQLPSRCSRSRARRPPRSSRRCRAPSRSWRGRCSAGRASAPPSGCSPSCSSRGPPWHRAAGPRSERRPQQRQTLRAASDASIAPRARTALAALAGSSRRATTSSSSAWTSGSSCIEASSARRRRAVASPSTSLQQVVAAALAQQALGLDERAVLDQLRRELLHPLAPGRLGLDDRHGPVALRRAPARARRGSRAPSCRSAGDRTC